MVHSRIREIRKEKGLTLQEVADLAGTTAQTIGRLETGARTLSISWVNRISEALGVEGAALLALPETGDFDIIGEVTRRGLVTKKAQGTLSSRLFAKSPVAVSVKENIGDFKAGDILVFETQNGSSKNLSGRECLILKDGKQMLCLAIPDKAGKKGSLVSLGEAREIFEGQDLRDAMPLVALVRRFS